MMKQCSSSLMISDDACFQQKPDEIEIINPRLQLDYYDNLDHFLWTPIQKDNPAMVIFTSGSTGRPKATVLSLGNLYFSAAGANSQMSLGPGNRWLMSLPLYHIGGLVILFRCLLS